MADTMYFTSSEVVILNGEHFAPSASVLNKYVVYASGKGVNANKLAVAAWSAALLANEQYGLIRLTPSVNSTLFGLVKTPTLLVEPTGVAIPLGLKQAAAETVKKMPKILEQAPIVTFVDAMRIDKLMNNVRRLVETQIVEADAVLINKVDAVDQVRLDNVTKLVMDLNPHVELLYGSARTGKGVKEVADIMVHGKAVVYDLTDAEDRFDKKYGE